MRDAPFGEIDFQSPLWTPDRVREAEADLRALGVEQRVVVAVHEESGDVVGVTEVEIQPHRAAVVVAGQHDPATDHAERHRRHRTRVPDQTHVKGQGQLREGLRDGPAERGEPGRLVQFVQCARFLDRGRRPQDADPLPLRCRP